jgi:Dienelactone hydrolase family
VPFRRVGGPGRTDGPKPRGANSVRGRRPHAVVPCTARANSCSRGAHRQRCARASGFYEHLAGMLAQDGFVACAVDYFFRVPPLANAEPGTRRAARALLGYWGDQDPMYDAETWAEFKRRLDADSVDHMIRIYPGIGHGFLRSFLDDPSAAGYATAQASWQTTREFLHQHLD